MAPVCIDSVVAFGAGTAALADAKTAASATTARLTPVNCAIHVPLARSSSKTVPKNPRENLKPVVSFAVYPRRALL
jgi:hypothetical protein